jgi:hypothetical protein
MCHTLIKAAQPHTAIHDNKSARCVATGVARVVHADLRGRHVDDLAQSNMSDDMRLRRAGPKFFEFWPFLVITRSQDLISNVRKCLERHIRYAQLVDPEQSDAEGTKICGFIDRQRHTRRNLHASTCEL